MSKEYRSMWMTLWMEVWRLFVSLEKVARNGYEGGGGIAGLSSYGGYGLLAEIRIPSGPSLLEVLRSLDITSVNVHGEAISFRSVCMIVLYNSIIICSELVIERVLSV